MKDKTYAVAFAYHDIKELQEKINDYLRSDEIEYVDLKYAVNSGNYDTYSAILIYKYIEQNEEEW